VIKKHTFLFIMVLINSLFFFFSCPVEQLLYSREHFDYEFSDEIIKKDQPIELTIRLGFGVLEDDDIIAIELLKNVETILLEGKLFEWDAKNAIFVDFVNPQKQEDSSDPVIVDEDTDDSLKPYCKLKLIFKKSGNYTLRLRRTIKASPWWNFDGGCYFTKINVVE